MLDSRSELLHEVVHRPIFLDQPGDLGSRVDDGGVIAPAELAADLWERGVGELTGEVHRHLSRVDDVLRAPVTAELLAVEAEALRDEVLDPLDRHLPRVPLWKDVLEDVLR